MKDSSFGGTLTLSLRVVIILTGIAAVPLVAQSSNETPANFKIAFIGDHGVSNLATAYFKDVKGVVADSFAVISNVEPLRTSADDPALEIVSDYDLEQNYPNPFNPSTTIGFHVKKASYSKLTIVNLLGEHVRTLLEGEFLAGEHIAQWDGRDDAGVRAPSGAYLIRNSYQKTYAGEVTAILRRNKDFTLEAKK
ncbi:MAG: FlgD immunoglobulin-like domain containing protein [bacterium]